MQRNEGASTSPAVDLTELAGHFAVLQKKRTSLRKQLDKGVPRSQFHSIHALLSLVTKAEDVLHEIRQQQVA